LDKANGHQAFDLNSLKFEKYWYARTECGDLGCHHCFLGAFVGGFETASLNARMISSAAAAMRNAG